MSVAALAQIAEPAPQASVAALPMYDLPELQGANDTLWAAASAALQHRGITEAPRALTRTTDPYAIWSDPALLVSQTCGYPFLARLAPHVRLVLTPRYTAPGCEGPFHRAVVVVHKGSTADNLADLRGARLALNAWDSNTGMNLLRAEVAQIAGGERWFGSVTVTGGHLQSAKAIAEDEADVASLDCVTWALLQRYRPELTVGLRVLLWTSRSPGLPLITSFHTDAHTVAAVREVFTALGASSEVRDARRELMLDGFNELSMRHYFVIRYFERLAVDLNYPNLV